MLHMPPQQARIAEYGIDEAPRLIVVVDTEEEFPWDQPHSRDNTSVSAMSELRVAQDIFNRYNLRPTYVIDYPVATKPDGFEPLKEIAQAGLCTVGAHLHPWVSPPFTETVNARNSFPGNLIKEQEEAKLTELVAAISENFVRPTIYKAGRYGVGENTAAILNTLGFNIDLSPTPGYSYVSEAGPDFTRFPDVPFFYSEDKLCIPCTGGFVGALRAVGRVVYPPMTSKLGDTLKLGGIASRLRLLERIRLSPEGFTLDELKRLSHTLWHSGVRTFTLSYHSPSLRPGCTPYVDNAQQLQTFLDTIEGYIEYFLEELGGRVATPDEIRDDFLEIHADARQFQSEQVS